MCIRDRDLAFFGETPTLVLVSVTPADTARLEELCARQGVPCARLGTVQGGDRLESGAAGREAVLRLSFGAEGLEMAVQALREVSEWALSRALGE